MKNRSGEKIKLTSIDELLGVVNEESAMEIEIDKIHPFAGHPFKVIDDEKMQDLIDSIQENGVLTPVLIRPDNHDGYEMISGHRRMHAAQLAGLVTIPAIVREMTDDDAVIAMVDANIQREELLPSEKAFAYKMKLEAMKRQAGRPSKNNSGQNDQNLSGLVSRDVLAQQVGESSKQIQRFIRLTELIPDLLELVDKKRLNFTI
ncbi:ParB/RepB/Spo0J family partition protein, partial [Coprococcus sp. CLA-AA-H190]